MEKKTLHEIMQSVLKENGGSMYPHDLAEVIRQRNLYTHKNGTPLKDVHIHAMVSNYPNTFARVDGKIALKESITPHLNLNNHSENNIPDGDMVGFVKRYIDLIDEDRNHRYVSWEHCYNAFKDSGDIPFLTLNLSFHLASWGMYRGSCGILWKDYRIHKKAAVLMKSSFSELRKDRFNMNDLPSILDLYDQLEEYYTSIEYIDPSGVKQNVSPTETLITKIMLGGIGCLPAMDNYFKAGFLGKATNLLGKKRFEDVIQIAENSSDEIKRCQEYVAKRIGRSYPQMKILDMYYWQKGYDMQLQKKK